MSHLFGVCVDPPGNCPSCPGTGQEWRYDQSATIRRFWKLELQAPVAAKL